MTEILKFMREEDFLVLLLAILAFWLLGLVFYQLPKRFLQSRTIMKHGYPPPHCDVFGDFKSNQTESDDDEGP